MTADTALKASSGKMDERVLPPLGMTGQQFCEAAIDAVQEIERYYSTIEERQVLPDISPGYLKKLLPGQAPEHGEAWEDIAKDIESKIMPGMTHWSHPAYMAFFPASSSYPGILGELWSAALSTPAFNWICAPVITELETVVLDWLADILALPDTFKSHGEGGGVIQGSASEAIVVAMIAARERYVQRHIALEGLTDPEEIEDRSCELRSRLVALGSDQAHSSTKKASNIAGTRYRSVVSHPENDFAMTGAALRAKIEDLLARDLHPYYLTVTIGTTNSCAVDDMASIAEVAKAYPDIWIHCDAAYAGAALACPEYQHLSKQMSFVDSFDMNMHKWLLTNFDASCLFVQKRKDLTSALGITPAYLKNDFTESGLVTDYRDWQIPLGRRFRSLKIWFVLRTWGVEGLRAHIRHHINLGNLFADLIRSRSDLFTILTKPAFALTVFTANPTRKQQALTNGVTHGGDPRPDQDREIPIKPNAATQHLEKANAATKEIHTRIDRSKEFFLTSTVVGGTFAIRVVSANPLAEEKYVRQCFDRLVATAEEVIPD